jgi:phosphosulfolactate synthase
MGLGGTLLEIAHARGRTTDALEWCDEFEMDFVEVSDGLGLMGSAKQDIVRRLAADRTVLAEIGRKAPDVPVKPLEWAAEAERDLDAGAHYILVEGRESGTVGAFMADGSVREDLVETLTARVPVSRLIFEAPRPKQQAWFVKQLGREVNLGNIRPDGVLALETLRLGLRADTAHLAVGEPTSTVAGP